jgi:hypothetical protein
MAVVAPATVGETWNVEQRIAVDGTISYWNMDVAVPVDVTAQVASFNSDGKCPCETTGVGAVVPTLVKSGSLGTIAGATASATANFSGLSSSVSTATVVGSLQSVTVSARKVTDGDFSGSSVKVTLSDGTVKFLMDGQSTTWSVIKDSDTSLAREILVEASGAAYANVEYTFI